MKKLIAIALVAAPFALSGAEAQTQAQGANRNAPVSAPVNGVLTVFGNDPCPADTICVRAPEADRYRIPKDLRDAGPIPRRNESFANRMAPIVQDNPTGIGSCSTVGPGGQTGCLVREVTQARQERRQEQQAQQTPVP